MENRYGIVPKGAAHECFLLFMNFWFIAIPVLAKRGVKLRNDYSHTKVISMIIIVLNCFVFLAFVSDGQDVSYALFMSLPTMLGAVILLFYGSVQKTYHAEVDMFVGMLKDKRSFTWTELWIYFPKNKELGMTNPNLAKSILNDLKSNFLIDYTDNGQVVEVIFVHPNLGGEVVNQEWACPNCGANNTATVLLCEYCGSAKKE